MSQDKEYQQMAKKASPPSPILKNILKAFFSGGFICALAQCFFVLYENSGINEETVKLNRKARGSRHTCAYYGLCKRRCFLGS